jgi:DNA-binding SARP family transcriptional activator
VLAAKSAAPIAGIQHWRHPAISRAIKQPITLFNAPSGYMPTEYLSSILVEQDKHAVWLRFEVEDRDPATCLLSLISAARSKNKQLGLGQETLKRMKQYPGGIFGWSALFELLAKEFSENLSQDCVIVLDGIHHLGHKSPVTELLISHFAFSLSRTRSCIINTHSEIAVGHIKGYSDIVGFRELQMHPKAFFELNNNLNTKLSEDCLHHLTELSQGRVVVLLGALQACQERGERCVEDTAKRAKNLNQMLVLLSRDCLLPVEPLELQALAITLESGYFQNDIYLETIGKTINIRGPWLQDLQNDWKRVHSIWNRPLKSVLHNYENTHIGYVCKLADSLCRVGASESAVSLLIKAEKFEQAAKIIEKQVDKLMSYGQWDLLHSWLRKIPQRIVGEFPLLAYAQGEIYSMYGFVDDARKIFGQVGNDYSNHKEVACRSLLAESTLKAWMGNQQGADRIVRSAYSLSRSSELREEQGWACYQLGVFAIENNELDLAQSYLTNAIRLIDNPIAQGLFQKIIDLIRVQENLGEQIENYSHLLKQTEHSQQKNSEQLIQLLLSIPSMLPEMLVDYGWLDLPLAFKLSHLNKYPATNGTSIFNKIHNWIQRIKHKTPPRATLSPLNLLFSTPIISEQKKTQIKEQNDKFLALGESMPVEKNKSSEPQLMIYSFGYLQVLREGKFVTNWTSHKAQLIFKYLLLHHQSLTPKETLMDTFWPEADLESARRNLHQAIYSLRQTLKSLEHNMHFIEFENEGYRINPLINIWLDFEVFETHCTSGQAKEHSGYIEQAMTEYSLAEELYQNHLFSDDLYEDWIQPYRQYYWQLYLSSAAQLADYYHEKRDFPRAISIAQRILHKDRCQEFAYQNLMKCFHRQGQRQLALHQFELCRQALMDELEVDPSEKTTQLFLEILNE